MKRKPDPLTVPEFSLTAAEAALRALVEGLERAIAEAEPRPSRPERQR
jgi:ribosomal protein S12 methylthiotransferase accessory factor YcaO